MRGWGAGRLPAPVAVGDLTTTPGSGSRRVGVMTTGPLGRSVLDRARAAAPSGLDVGSGIAADMAASSGSRHAAREGFQQEPLP